MIGKGQPPQDCRGEVAWRASANRHSGAMRSIEPGISRFRVWSFGPSRNDADDHIGGVMPSRPTLTRLASSVPSSFLTAPKMMILAPGFSSDLSPTRKVTIGVPGGTTTFFSPSLYLTVMV